MANSRKENKGFGMSRRLVERSCSEGKKNNRAGFIDVSKTSN